MALRTNEYRDRNVQYEWMQDALGLRKVTIWDFSVRSPTTHFPFFHSLEAQGFHFFAGFLFKLHEIIIGTVAPKFYSHRSI